MRQARKHHASRDLKAGFLLACILGLILAAPMLRSAFSVLSDHQDSRQNNQNRNAYAVTPPSTWRAHTQPCPYSGPGIPSGSTASLRSHIPSTPVVITDASGREVRLPALPQRLAVVGRGPQYLLHLLYMFPEGPERLVGMEQRGRTASDFLTALFPGIDAKLTLLPNPGPEAVAGLHPDLVLMKGTGGDPLAESLAKVGIPTAFLNLETPEEYYRDIANLGVLLGNEAQADRIIAFYRKNVARVEAALAGLDDADRPSVLVAMGNTQRGKHAVRVPAVPWMQTYQVRAGGGRPVWLNAAERAGGWAVVNLEQIAAWDPDRIVFIVWYSIEAPAFLDRLASDRQWKNIRAVREGNVRYFPTDFYGWDTPDVRWILGLTWMAAALHPERFPGYDIAAEVRSFYSRLYGLDEATVDAEIVPLIKTDFR